MEEEEMTLTSALTKHLNNPWLFVGLAADSFPSVSTSRRPFRVFNPSILDLRIARRVPHMGADDARAAIEMASAAQEPWSRPPARERSNVLWEWHRLIWSIAMILQRS